ncbi:HlyD family secretion protein [Pseudaminobacter soli (ex Li et al. 2025)]|uniref:Multidrug ABC transporter permease n=1 Tax=Pseudaminobacter soli (ex Li et al. 2025) TaxID=1295366 RepID=A0A2P7SK95_9HYPH|nr:HlyD family secretion protein [Mesorhizobium soli]PSJ62887.1 multidrug ABC transporter permease [Mesorhizobium soli]
MDSPVSAPVAGSMELKPVRKRRTARYVLGAMACLAVIGGGAYGFDWYRTGRFVQSTDNAYLRADKVSMAPVVAGQIAEVYVSDNQKVVAGQPLVKIDPRRYELSVREAQGTVNARKADLAKSEADTKQQDALIAQAAADLDNAEHNAELAKREFDRTAPLAARGVESQQKVDQTRIALDQAKSVIRLKSAALDAARQQVSSLKAQIEQAHAQLATAEESLRRAELDLEDTVLRSPIEGRVGDRTVQLGQYVQPGTLLLTLVPTDKIYLVANFKETQIAGMREGQPATIHIDAFPQFDMKGVVDSFAPGTGAQFALLPPENATGNFTKIVQRVPVRIKLDADQKEIPPLVPGLSIEVAVNTKASARDEMAETK